MNYIYTDTRSDRRYVLNPELREGSKVCLVDMTSCEDKFIAVSTLKRWYTKTETNDVVVELRAFTGMKLGLHRANHALNTNRVYFVTKSNKMLIFDYKTGEQINAKTPKFANRIVNTYSYLWSTLEWAVS